MMRRQRVQRADAGRQIVERRRAIVVRLVLIRERSFALTKARVDEHVTLRRHVGVCGARVELGENAYLTSGGVMFGTVTGGPAVSGSFDGVIEQCELSEEWGGRRNCSASATIANQSCTSSTHRMILARR